MDLRSVGSIVPRTDLPPIPSPHPLFEGRKASIEVPDFGDRFHVRVEFDYALVQLSSVAKDRCEKIIPGDDDLRH